MDIRGISYITGTLLLALLLSMLSGCQSESRPYKERQIVKDTDINELKMAMLADIASTLFSDASLSSDVKNDIARLAISPLRRQSQLLLSGSDPITRPIAVSFQNAFEQSVLHMLDEHMITEAVAIIHTRKPATPLCNPAGEALSDTMHTGMQADTNRRKTIQDRTMTVRQIASYGPPISLYIAYPAAGLWQRSSAEQAIYQAEINNKNNKSLHNAPLTCSTLPDSLIGASYILKTRQGNRLFFGNSGHQAIDGTGDTTWNYWFGSLDDAPVRARYDEVTSYLKKCGLKI